MVEVYTGSWQPALTSDKSARARDVALHVADRLREQERIEDAAVATMQQTAFPKSAHWHPAGVAQGYAGLAIMCSYLDACFPEKEWDVVGHSYLQLAVRDIESRSYLPTGIFAGLSGIAFAAWSLSHGGKRYGKLLAALDEALLPQTMSLAQKLTTQKKDVSVGQFDVISGLSGVGAYLLCRKHEQHVATALNAVLESLVAVTAIEDGLPRWYTPARLLGDEKTVHLYPNGNLNCGLAHGIPGPLGLLALAHISGVTCDGMEEAIDRVATWLLQHRLDDQWGLNWPTAVRVEADGTVPTSLSKASTSPYDPSRTAWCYGSPGLVRALWFAGKALRNSEYQRFAVESMEAVYRRPLEVRRIDSPTFCHGVAGLLQIVLRFAHDTESPQSVEAAQILTDQVLSLYDPDTRLGYYNLEPGGGHVDQPGLLDGAPGVLLVLLAAASYVEPSWDRLFLLS